MFELKSLHVPLPFFLFYELVICVQLCFTVHYVTESPGFFGRKFTSSASKAYFKFFELLSLILLSNPIQFHLQLPSLPSRGLIESASRPTHLIGQPEVIKQPLTVRSIDGLPKGGHSVFLYPICTGHGIRRLIRSLGNGRLPAIASTTHAHK
jgi:hypothetical protein